MATEKMYGMQEHFSYLHCAACGVLHLLDVPQDLSRFYPTDSYYSVNRQPGPLRRWLIVQRDRGCDGRSVVGRWLRERFPNPTLEATLRAAPRRDSRILDVGCGGGDLLKSLARLGFTHLEGVDPLLSTSSQQGAVKLIAGELGVVDGSFDLITFHHSLEHMPQQADVLAKARERLAPGGLIVVRIPTCDSLAFEAYGAQWVQLDAPRHLFLHSYRSIGLVANAAGLSVERIECDSQAMQFWGSDLYRDGLPLVSTEMADYKRRHERFYRELSDWVNDRGRGDQIVVHLRPTP